MTMKSACTIILSVLHAYRQNHQKRLSTRLFCGSGIDAIARLVGRARQRGCATVVMAIERLLWVVGAYSDKIGLSTLSTRKRLKIWLKTVAVLRFKRYYSSN